MMDTLDPSFIERNSNSVLLAQVLHIVRCPPGGGNIRTTYKNTKNNAVTLSQGGPYDRLIWLAAIETNTPICIISRSKPASTALLNEFKDSNAGIGSIVGIQEPLPTHVMYNDGMEILETKYPLRVLKKKMKLPRLIWPPTIEPEDDQLKYSTLGAVEIACFGLTVKKAICGGSICDRRIAPGPKKVCACPFTVRRAKVVFDGYLVVYKKGGDPTDDDDVIMSDPHFRSWSFTDQFVKNIPSNAKKANFEPWLGSLRKSVSKQINTVNLNGGWDVIVYAQKGFKVDQGEQEKRDHSNEIYSDETKYHVISICPRHRNLFTPKVCNAMKFQLPTMSVILENNGDEDE